MKIIIMVFVTFLLVHTAYAATGQDYDRVTTYATLIGRSVACGQNIQYGSKRVGAWMDRTFFGKEKSAQILVFTTAVQYAAEQQKAGNSPDTCRSVVKTYNKIDWP